MHLPGDLPGRLRLVTLRPTRPCPHGQEKASETVCKPSSVPTLRSGTVIHLRRRLPDVSSGRPGSRATPLASNFRPTAPLFGLAPGRACPFHSGPRLPAAGSSLWRWSSPLGGRVLPATLRRGARTFLVSVTACADGTRDHPTISLDTDSTPGRQRDRL